MEGWNASGSLYWKTSTRPKPLRSRGTRLRIQFPQHSTQLHPRTPPTAIAVSVIESNDMYMLLHRRRSYWLPGHSYHIHHAPCCKQTSHANVSDGIQDKYLSTQIPGLLFVSHSTGYPPRLPLATTQKKTTNLLYARHCNFVLFVITQKNVTFWFFIFVPRRTSQFVSILANLFPIRLPSLPTKCILRLQ